MSRVVLPGRLVAALQQALAAEHAAVYGYAALGPRVPATDAGVAHQFQAAHRRQRDAVMTTLTDAGREPVPSQAAYSVSARLSASGARKAALKQESAACTAWRWVVAVAAAADPAITDPAVTSVRAAALTALSAGAVRATYWRAEVHPDQPTTAFPGI